MKNLFKLFILTLSLLSGNAMAQSEKFTSAMKKGIEQLNNSKIADDFIASANQFERIAKVESKEWLPVYYASYANLIAGIMTQDNNLKDQYFDKALSEVDQAQNISADNSEIYTLKGYCEFMKMTVDPQSRLSFIGQANASLDKAKTLNPENPRPYFVEGQNTFYTPEAFGGGKATAKPLLETASAKFASFKPTSDLAPSWGGERAKMLLEQCK